MEPLYDSKKERVLLPNGYSFVDEERFLKGILNGDEGLITEPSDDIESYERRYGLKAAYRDDFEDPVPPSIEHTENELETLCEAVWASNRLKGTKEEEKRLIKELDFIDRQKAVLFFLKVHNLIQQFKRDNVVWGVGRGSSCACYVLYLLEVHDVDALTWKLPFKEFSKEDE